MLPLAALLATLALAESPTAGAIARAHDRAAAAPQDEAAKLRADLIQKLLGLATWCNEKELFLQRDNVWRSVLALDSENAAARQGLRYARDGQGKWKEPAQHDVKDRNAAALPEFGTKRSEVVGAWRDQLFALLDKEQADAARRAAALEEVLQLDPDDALVHGMRGEARSGAKWVLAETAAGEARRAEIKTLLQKGRDGAPAAAKVAPTPEDLALLPAWKSCTSSDGMRLLCQTGDAEAKDLCTLTHAACALAEGLFGKPMPPSDGFAVYVLVDPAERDQLAAALKDATDAERKNWKAGAGFGIPHSASVVIWDKLPNRRLDCFARHLTANLLFKGFHVESPQGWAFEGLGLYLAAQLAGTRLTWFIGTATGETSGLRARLFVPKTDWFAEADKLLKGPNPPKLAELLGKDLAAIKLEEMVLAQAFAAFLVEGNAKELPEILTRIGAGEASVAVVEAVTKRPLAETEKRLARWIEERH